MWSGFYGKLWAGLFLAENSRHMITSSCVWKTTILDCRVGLAVLYFSFNAKLNFHLIGYSFIFNRPTWEWLGSTDMCVATGVTLPPDVSQLRVFCCMFPLPSCSSHSFVTTYQMFCDRSSLGFKVLFFSIGTHKTHWIHLGVNRFINWSSGWD